MTHPWYGNGVKQNLRNIWQEFKLDKMVKMRH